MLEWLLDAHARGFVIDDDGTSFQCTAPPDQALVAVYAKVPIYPEMLELCTRKSLGAIDLLSDTPTEYVYRVKSGDETEFQIRHMGSAVRLQMQMIPAICLEEYPKMDPPPVDTRTVRLLRKLKEIQADGWIDPTWNNAVCPDIHARSRVSPVPLPPKPGMLLNDSIAYGLHLVLFCTKQPPTADDHAMYEKYGSKVYLHSEAFANPVWLRDGGTVSIANYPNLVGFEYSDPLSTYFYQIIITI